MQRGCLENKCKTWSQEIHIVNFQPLLFQSEVGNVRYFKCLLLVHFNIPGWNLILIWEINKSYCYTIATKNKCTLMVPHISILSMPSWARKNSVYDNIVTFRLQIDQIKVIYLMYVLSHDILSLLTGVYQKILW